MKRIALFSLSVILLSVDALCQTESDGLMMAKRNFCGGVIYNRNQWKHYWEGTFYRENQNIGSFRSNSFAAMGNYGISDKLNFIFMLPYVSNRVTAGTLAPQRGFQDISTFLKYEMLNKDFKGTLASAYIVAGVSAPVSNYVADYLPIAIGMRSKTANIRLIADVQRKRWYATASAAYVRRSNVEIDRKSYYTTEMIYSNQVDMPDVANFNYRIGWRKSADLYFELMFDRMNTLGGFDIRKNDMPFLSNNMDMSRIGFNCKISVPELPGFSFMGQVMQTVQGRNMGKSTLLGAGLVYQFEVKKGQTK